MRTTVLYCQTERASYSVNDRRFEGAVRASSAAAAAAAAAATEAVL